jgi:hypothetical protein
VHQAIHAIQLRVRDVERPPHVRHEPERGVLPEHLCEAAPRAPVAKCEGNVRKGRDDRAPGPLCSEGMRRKGVRRGKWAKGRCIYGPLDNRTISGVVCWGWEGRRGLKSPKADEGAARTHDGEHEADRHSRGGEDAGPREGARVV